MLPPALSELPLSGDLGGRANKHHQKMNYHYQKYISLPCIHRENSDLRWKICAKHKFVDTNIQGCAWKTLLCQILGSFQKVRARKPSNFLDGNHIFETKLHQSPKSGLVSAFAAMAESSPSTQVSYCSLALNQDCLLFPVHLHFYHYFIVNICGLISTSPLPSFPFPSTTKSWQVLKPPSIWTRGGLEQLLWGQCIRFSCSVPTKSNPNSSFL